MRVGKGSFSEDGRERQYTNVFANPTHIVWARQEDDGSTTIGVVTGAVIRNYHLTVGEIEYQWSNQRR